MHGDSARAVEKAARDAYGRLVAWLASRGGGLAAAEDSVADALEAALRSWPETGVPERPEAWLLTVARNRSRDRARFDTRREILAERYRIEAQETVEGPFRSGLPDRRLELMLVCTHPKLPVRVRTPLILQTVLGLSAERIAGVMLDKPSAIAQRLVRAKRRIETEAIPFEIPAPEAIEARMSFLLDAIYAAYGAGALEADGAADKPRLAHEALWLARWLIDLAPGSAEAKGLYALMLYSESRRGARTDPEGHFVPLDEQNPARWDQGLLQEAEKALWMAAGLDRPGVYQLEASIQSLHSDRARTGVTDWPKILELYRVLVRNHPSVGAQLGLAATLGRVGQIGAALHALDALAQDRTQHHQPYWCVRAFLLFEAGQADEARAAYLRAQGLTADPSIRAWLEERAQRCEE